MDFMEMDTSRVRRDLHIMPLQRIHPNVDKFDLSIIKAFYDEHSKSYKTPLCWECSLCRILEYTSKYGGMRNSG